MISEAHNSGSTYMRGEVLLSSLYNINMRLLLVTCKMHLKWGLMQGFAATEDPHHTTAS